MLTLDDIIYTSSKDAIRWEAIATSNKKQESIHWTSDLKIVPR